VQRLCLLLESLKPYCTHVKKPRTNKHSFLAVYYLFSTANVYKLYGIKCVIKYVRKISLLKCPAKRNCEWRQMHVFRTRCLYTPTQPTVMNVCHVIKHMNITEPTRLPRFLVVQLETYTI